MPQLLYGWVICIRHFTGVNPQKCANAHTAAHLRVAGGFCRGVRQDALRARGRVPRPDDGVWTFRVSVRCARQINRNAAVSAAATFAGPGAYACSTRVAGIPCCARDGRTPFGSGCARVRNVQTCGCLLGPLTWGVAPGWSGPGLWPASLRATDAPGQ